MTDFYLTGNGVNCFLNCAIHFLFEIFPPNIDEEISYYKNEGNKKDVFLDYILKMFKIKKSSSKKSIIFNGDKLHSLFVGHPMHPTNVSQQEDAIESLMIIIGIVEDQYQHFYKMHILPRINFSETHKILCSNCYNVDIKKIGGNYTIHLSIPKRVYNKDNLELSLHDLIEEYMGINNHRIEYKCDICDVKKLSDSRVKFSIPNENMFLIFVINRITYSTTTNSYKKSLVPIHYPVSLYFDRKIYKYHGSIHHYGHHILQGHYVYQDKDKMYDNEHCRQKMNTDNASKTVMALLYKIQQRY